MAPGSGIISFTIWFSFPLHMLSIRFGKEMLSSLREPENDDRRQQTKMDDSKYQNSVFGNSNFSFIVMLN